jgi:periplasmic protein TonB
MSSVSGNTSARIRVFVLGLSAAVHVALAIGAVYAPKKKHVEQISIAAFDPDDDSDPEDEAPDELPPPPPPPPPPPRVARAEPAVVEEAAEPEVAEAPPVAPTPGLGAGYEGFTDLGMVGDPGGPGIAVPTEPRPRPRAERPPPKPRVERKERRLAAKEEDTCAEPLVRPRPTETVGVTYPETARRSEVEGVVRVEVSVDEQGRIVEAKVVSGLGYGLDEAALEAARQWSFQPATRCGKPVAGSLRIGMRFTLRG